MAYIRRSYEEGVGDLEYMVQVDQDIPVNVSVPVKQELTVPLHVQINQDIPIES